MKGSRTLRILFRILLLILILLLLIAALPSCAGKSGKGLLKNPFKGEPSFYDMEAGSVFQNYSGPNSDIHKMIFD